MLCAVLATMKTTVTLLTATDERLGSVEADAMPHTVELDASEDVEELPMAVLLALLPTRSRLLLWIALIDGSPVALVADTPVTVELDAACALVAVELADALERRVMKVTLLTSTATS